MTHPRNKKQRNELKRRRKDRIREISRFGYNPYVGSPRYADKKIDSWNYGFKLSESEFRKWADMTNEYSTKPFYIKEHSRCKSRAFIKKNSKKAIRRSKNVPKKGNGANKIYDFWWDLL